MEKTKEAIGAAVKSVAGGLADLLLPAVCGACRGADVADQGLCQECNVKLLSLVALPYCPRCGGTLGPGVRGGDDGCPGCPTKMYRFERLVRLGPYAQPLRAMIQDLKYHRQEMMRRRLCKLLASAVSAQIENPADLVISIPMHWRRRLFRGYDHAKILASSLADCLDLPLGVELARIRHTPPQARLTRTERIENVRGAFALRGNSAIRGANVLLVDDVTTTGATANEAARALLDGGASHVTLAVLAKADPPKPYAQHPDV